MITLGVYVFLTALLWYTGYFTLAFWVVVFVILQSAFGAARAIINPDWYQTRRMEAGLDIRFLNARHGVSSLIVTKLILIGILSFVAWKLGQNAGYF